VLDAEELRRLIRTARREPLVPQGAGTPVAVGASDLQRLLPHRPPCCSWTAWTQSISSAGRCAGTAAFVPAMRSRGLLKSA
jgi:hypothetical protein